MSGWAWWIDHRLGLNRFLCSRTKEASERGLPSPPAPHRQLIFYAPQPQSAGTQGSSLYVAQRENLRKWTGAWSTEMRKDVTSSRRFRRSNQQQQQQKRLDSFDCDHGERRGTLCVGSCKANLACVCEGLEPGETVCMVWKLFDFFLFLLCKHEDNWCNIK